MEWVKTVHWIALFVAFLGPFLATGAAFEWLVDLMLLLGIIVALATYNMDIPQNAVLYLLIASLAFLLLPSGVSYAALFEYVRGVVTLGAWYILPIAIAQGWKALIG